MSLRWRIMLATVFIVLLTVLASIGVGYYATQARLGVFVDRIGGGEAFQLAQKLSREYTAAGDWRNLDAALAEAGFLYEGVAPNGEHESGEGNSSESSHRDQIRVVVTDAAGRIVRDNREHTPPGAIASDLGGHRETVFDLNANQPVGHVYVDVNEELLSNESDGFLQALLYIAAIGGALTAAVAMLLAAWFSKRITAPVSALTEATQAIAQGETASLPITSSDELGRMSAAFNQMTTALETQRELRRRLINDVTHELNTPLSVIKLESQGMRDGLQSPEQASSHILQEVDRLGGLVSDLDWLAESDLGEMRLELESSSMHEILQTEFDRWQPQSQARDVSLSLEVAGELPDLKVDRLRMGQALGNLVNNAIKCTGGGGEIVLAAKSDHDGTLTISITDDGIGIAADELPRVFDRFYRTAQSRSRGIGGKGLGLAIAQAIVEGHGGTIDAASDGPDRGTCVSIRLPSTGQ